MSLTATLLFHLNLNYSAIEVSERSEVVRRCYWPLLELLRGRDWLRLSIEASGHTLERIARLDPEWIEALSIQLAQGRVELVGSGDSQLIGPLVPASVNLWNQRLGQEAYELYLGRRPRAALVNELAWSQGIIDAYAEAGYETLLMEWNNPRRQHPEWHDELRYGRVWTRSPSGRRIALLWVDALAFQKFQRAVFGELTIEEYVEWVFAREGESKRHLALYANDAEIFDYRPGRYRTEAPIAATSEWSRIGAILDALERRGIRFTTPERLAVDPAFAPYREVVLSTAGDPIPVKKQPKYNATRWALSGWDDVGLNARCFDRADELEREGGTAEEWRVLCRAWGSDLRTHLTPRRWEALKRALPDPAPRAASAAGGKALEVSRVERDDRRLYVETDGVRLKLLTRRGLAIDELVFHGVSPRPLCGTLPQGTFDEIDWAADFYTGHTVLEIPARSRVTDLEQVEPSVVLGRDHVEVRAVVDTHLGPLEKEVRVYADRVDLTYRLAAWSGRPVGTLRTGMVTLMPQGFGRKLRVACANGGQCESFELTEGFDHGASVSALVSASAAFGATEGKLSLGDDAVALDLSWPRSRVAALPLLTCRRIGEQRFTRVAFSLSEIDETHRPGAPLHDFELSLRARRLAA